MTDQITLELATQRIAEDPSQRRLVAAGSQIAWDDGYTIDEILSMPRAQVREKISQSLDDLPDSIEVISLNPEKAKDGRCRPSNCPPGEASRLADAHAMRVEEVRRFTGRSIASFAPGFLHWRPREQTFLRYAATVRFIDAGGLEGVDEIEMQCSAQAHPREHLDWLDMPRSIAQTLEMGEAIAELAGIDRVVPSMSDRVWGPNSQKRADYYGKALVAEDLLELVHAIARCGRPYRRIIYWVGNPRRRWLVPVFAELVRLRTLLDRGAAA